MKPWTTFVFSLAVAVATATGAPARELPGRPQLLVLRATADLDAERLHIEGQNLLTGADTEVVVTLAGEPVNVLAATESEVLAELPAGLEPAPTCSRCRVGAARSSRTSSTWRSARSAPKVRRDRRALRARPDSRDHRGRPVRRVRQDRLDRRGRRGPGCRPERS